EWTHFLPLPLAFPCRPMHGQEDKIEPWESKSHMTRSAVCFALLLSCCAVLAQSSAPAAASNPAPSRPVPTGVTTDVSPDLKQFQKIEDTWSEAINARDQYNLELVLSPLFVDVSASGDITTRTQ